jgi:hypothetical protein
MPVVTGLQGQNDDGGSGIKWGKKVASTRNRKKAIKEFV